MPVLRCGLAVWTLGTGLKLLFNQTTHIAVYIVVLAIEGAGVGWVHQPGACDSRSLTDQVYSLHCRPCGIAGQLN